MERYTKPPVDVGDRSDFKTIVRTLFEHRRKMIRKALKALPCDTVQLLEIADIDGTRRGETLDLSALASLSRASVRPEQTANPPVVIRW